MKDERTHYLYEQYKTLIPRTKDLTLVLLKGHLLLEEQLMAFIKVNCERPNEIDGLRLNFAQKVGLARALGAHALPAQVWKFTKSINRLRNQMAHTLVVPSISGDVDAVLRNYYEEEFELPGSEQKRSTILRQTIGLTCALIEGYTEGRMYAKQYEKANKANSADARRLIPTLNFLKNEMS